MKGRVLAVLLTLRTACSLGQGIPGATVPPGGHAGSPTGQHLHHLLCGLSKICSRHLEIRPPGAAPRCLLSALLLAADGTPQGLDWETCPTSPVLQKDRKVFIRNYFGLAFVARTTPATWVGEGKDCGSGDSWRGHPTPPCWAGASWGRGQASLVSAPDARPLTPPAGCKGGPPTPACTSFSPTPTPRPPSGRYPRASALEETWTLLGSIPLPCLTEAA